MLANLLTTRTNLILYRPKFWTRTKVLFLSVPCIFIHELEDFINRRKETLEMYGVVSYCLTIFQTSLSNTSRM